MQVHQLRSLFPKTAGVFTGPGLWLSEAVVGFDGVFGGKGFWGTLIFSAGHVMGEGIPYGSMSSS